MDIFKPVLMLNWKNVAKSDAKRIASQTPAANVVQIIDLPYIDDGTQEHLLDIYYPENTVEKLPVVVDIHGGGWLYGYKEINKHFCLELANRGFVVASINYRLADKYCFKDQIEDIFASFEWLSHNLTRYPADIDNIFLAGDSAGGHFACVCSAVISNPMLADDFDINSNSLHFKAVAAISPAVHLSGANPIMEINIPSLLGKNHRKSDLYKYMDFSKIANDNLPPFYIVTSSGDFIRMQAYKLKRILQNHNIECEFYDYCESFKYQHVFAVTNPFTLPAQKVIRDIASFFKSKM